MKVNKKELTEIVHKVVENVLLNEEINGDNYNFEIIEIEDILKESYPDFTMIDKINKIIVYGFARFDVDADNNVMELYKYKIEMISDEYDNKLELSDDEINSIKNNVKNVLIEYGHNFEIDWDYYNDYLEGQHMDDYEDK